MKVMNPEYECIEIVPLDIALRDMVGVSVDPDNLDGIAGIIEDMLLDSGKYRDKIAGAVKEYLYNPGQSGQIGGRYILASLEQKKLSKYSEEE
jgi:YidC/Oxa1 family membrane protein insertase